ncbi:hypothetical protein WMY93_029068 [Mugilogobius chulae]|uniref:Protein NPAT C-terminal domain-containing protein n=1 Tax=Mugilogobius chulae TaxID=88201 RepID=A0AAW0N151_9GOBI
MPPSTMPSSSTGASTTQPSTSSKSGADPNNIMSLKIIISDNQEEDSTTDTALTNAISSITGDKIPTIYLNSPAKTPIVPGTPKSSTDEAAHAVSCLQRSEAVIASPLTGTSQPQQSYIIQLPFDGATNAASYFLLTEPPAADAKNRQKIVPAPVSKGQVIAPAQFGVAPQAQGFTTGSALILPSPIKPMVLPLSVMGQNTLGNVQMVPNQLLAIPNPPVVQQSDTVKTLPAGAAKPLSHQKTKYNTEEDGNREKESRTSRSMSSDSSIKSGSRKDKEALDKAKTREGRSEKRTQENTNVTANKENEQQSASSSSAPASSNAQSKSSKPPSKTSVLAKQAAEMLQDIQALNSPSTPKGADLSSQEESGSDCPKTPTRARKSRDGEATPRHIIPPNSSDIPTCSPASEAGSESSINMATGTPLKNSLRQEGAGEQSPTTSKMTKKRKQSTPTSSPPAKKESKRTPSKKKERKKLVECFPQDLDVDKFLSSLHYDE